MALNSGKILMRRGQEVNFDPNKMMPGEWAVSLDNKYVRMCFSPSVCVRMATYDAFEADMVQIQRILADCQTIEEAVKRINDEISVKAQAVAEYASQAKQYRDEAEQFRNEAFSSTPEGYLDLVEQVGENTRKIAEGVGGVSSYNDLENKPKINDVVLEGEKTLDELGIASKEALEETDNKVNIIIEHAELRFKETASGENIHLDDSADSKLVEFGLYGKAVQNGEPTPQNPVDIEVAGASGSVEVKSENEDGTKSKTATIPTENGLAGIPVDSGGNYTDSNGQQWICDEIVRYADGSGEYIKRVKTVRVTSEQKGTFSHPLTEGQRRFAIKSSGDDWISESLGTTAISTHFVWNYLNSGNHGKFYVTNTYAVFTDNDSYWSNVEAFKSWLDANEAYITYPLAQPITTPLTAEQLAEIEKLSTFYPVTNISNDFDCGMKVKYIVDSKNYIDNQLAIQAKLQEEALLNMLLLMPEEVQASMIEKDTNNLLNESEV